MSGRKGSGWIDIRLVLIDRVPAPQQLLKGILSPDELCRASRKRRPADQVEAVTTRALLRFLIGHALAVPAKDVRFKYGRNGKPEIDPGQNPCGLTISAAHSHGMALLGIGSGGPFGLDIECCSVNWPFEELAPTLLEGSLRAAWETTPESLRPGLFYQTWARREACAKASGTGIAGADTTTCAAGSGLTTEDLNVGPSHRAAVAYSGRHRCIRLCRWNGSDSPRVQLGTSGDL